MEDETSIRVAPCSRSEDSTCVASDQTLRIGAAYQCQVTAMSVTSHTCCLTYHTVRHCPLRHGCCFHKQVGALPLPSKASVATLRQPATVMWNPALVPAGEVESCISTFLEKLYVTDGYWKGLVLQACREGSDSYEWARVVQVTPCRHLLVSVNCG